MNIEAVKLFPEVTQKYIVAKVSGLEQLILWGNPNVEWHKDITTEMEESGIVVENVLGGGRIRVVSKSRNIYVWGKSSVYGEISFTEVKDILKVSHVDYAVLNEVPDGE